MMLVNKYSLINPFCLEYKLVGFSASKLNKPVVTNYTRCHTVGVEKSLSYTFQIVFTNK